MPNFIAEFSPQAEEIIHFAQKEAILLRHNYLGTEHILLGLLHVGEESAAYTLQAMGVNLLSARTATELIIGRGEQHLCVTLEFRHAIHLAADEAQNLQQHIRAEHLLLALTLMPESKAGLVLQHLDISLDELRTKTLQALPTLEGAPAEHAAPKSGFNKFTQRARQAIVRTTQEVWSFQQNYNDIRIEHFFLGLLCAGDGAAMQVLTQLDLDMVALEQAFVQRLCLQDHPIQQSSGLNWTLQSKRAIELAVREARQFNHHYIGTEHFLLGMIAVSEEHMKSIFSRLGLNLKRTDNDDIGSLFTSFGLNLKRVRSTTLSVLLAGTTDDPA